MRSLTVMPAKAGIHTSPIIDRSLIGIDMDPSLRWGDGWRETS